MRTIRKHILFIFHARFNSFLFVCMVAIFITILVPIESVTAQVTPDDPVTSLKEIFGDPDVFVKKFEDDIKDKAEEIVSFLVASFGFRLVIKSFMGGG